MKKKTTILGKQVSAEEAKANYDRCMARMNWNLAIEAAVNKVKEYSHDIADEVRKLKKDVTD